MDEQNNTPATPQPPVNEPVQPPATTNSTPATPASQAEPTATPEAPSPVKPPKKERGLLSFILTITVALVLVQVIIAFFFQSYKVFGSSMYPTLHDGDRLIISKVGRTWAKVEGETYAPKRGEIIVFANPREPDVQLIKRVIGLPGERVVVQNGTLTVYNQDNPNGFNPDDADYGKDLPRTSGKTDITVPKDHIFVSGDNREGVNSLDSRNELGTIPEDNIVGTLKVRLWPFDAAKFF